MILTSIFLTLPTSGAEDVARWGDGVRLDDPVEVRFEVDGHAAGLVVLAEKSRADVFVVKVGVLPAVGIADLVETTR